LSDFEPHREGVVEDLVETIGQLIVGHRIARGRDGIQTQEPPDTMKADDSTSAGANGVSVRPSVLGSWVSGAYQIEHGVA
jgi:hypothetical protein